MTNTSILKIDNLRRTVLADPSPSPKVEVSAETTAGRGDSDIKTRKGRGSPVTSRCTKSLTKCQTATSMRLSTGSSEGGKRTKRSQDSSASSLGAQSTESFSHCRIETTCI